MSLRFLSKQSKTQLLSRRLETFSGDLWHFYDNMIQSMIWTDAAPLCGILGWKTSIWTFQPQICINISLWETICVEHVSVTTLKEQAFVGWNLSCTTEAICCIFVKSVAKTTEEVFCLCPGSFSLNIPILWWHIILSDRVHWQVK